MTKLGSWLAAGGAVFCAHCAELGEACAAGACDQSGAFLCPSLALAPSSDAGWQALEVWRRLDGARRHSVDGEPLGLGLDEVMQAVSIWARPGMGLTCDLVISIEAGRRQAWPPDDEGEGAA